MYLCGAVHPLSPLTLDINYSSQSFSSHSWEISSTLPATDAMVSLHMNFHLFANSGIVFDFYFHPIRQICRLEMHSVLNSVQLQEASVKWFTESSTEKCSTRCTTQEIFSVKGYGILLNFRNKKYGDAQRWNMKRHIHLKVGFKGSFVGSKQWYKSISFLSLFHPSLGNKSEKKIVLD